LRLAGAVGVPEGIFWLYRSEESEKVRYVGG
jgi:hypothetical protein